MTPRLADDVPATARLRDVTDTKQRIIAATLATVRERGAAGATARAIGEAGDLNPALIFYHFGSIEGALVAAARHDTQQRLARYGERLADVESLGGLVAVARELHHENLQEGNVTGLVQMLAATATHPDLRAPLADIFDPWIDLIRDTLERVLGSDHLEGVGSTTDLATGITSLFLGLELLTHLGDRYDRAGGLLGALEQTGELLEAFLAFSQLLDEGSS